MDRFGEATPTVMLALLEETAAEHCLSIGYGLYDLIKINIGWLLVSGSLVMNRYPRYKEKIRISTWLSEYSTIRGIRENVIYDSRNNVIGKAKGLWLFFDIEKRKPIPVFEEIKTKWSLNPKSILSKSAHQKISPLTDAKYSNEIIVRTSDVDMYQHANNIRYLQWLIDTIPEETIIKNNLKQIEGKFLSEINGGDTILMLTHPEDSEHAFKHTIINKNTGKICAVAKTGWETRIQ